MTQLSDLLQGEDTKAVRKAPFPKRPEFMLAVLTQDYFSDPGWLYERKLDGERVMVLKQGDNLRLVTRNGLEVNDTYPELVEALRDQPPGSYVADGEVVAFCGSVSSFSRLQQRMQIKDRKEARRSGVAVHLYLFDLLYLDRYSLEELPLRRRKSLLKRALRFKRPLHFTQHRNEKGEAYLKSACQRGWEGVIAKRSDASYHHGRSRDWLKFKCDHGQELVIGGFTDPQGEREGFGALLVGYFDKKGLRYAGKVGTGFDEEFLKDFAKKLKSIQVEDCPFEDEVREKNAAWVEPKLVGEFGFTEWTNDGKLRHPRFLGLRRDKKAKEVSREEADEN